MAVKTSWSAGDVLAAADLTDTFAAKAPTASPTFTGTVALPSTTTLDGVTLGNSKILQVVSTTKQDVFTVASTSLVDVTGLSANITPSSASNKVLVMVTLALNHTAAASGAYGVILRGSTIIGAGTASGSRPAGSFFIRTSLGSAANGEGPFCHMYLDSPSTTSATTYKIQIAGESGTTATVNRGPANDNDQALFPRLASSITLFEVSA